MSKSSSKASLFHDGGARLFAGYARWCKTPAGRRAKREARAAAKLSRR